MKRPFSRLVLCLTLTAVSVGALSGCADGSTRRATAPVEFRTAAATPIPAATTASTATSGAIPDGWTTFKAEGFELSAPQTFQGGKPTSDDYNQMVQGLQQAGQNDLASLLDQYRKNLNLDLVLVTSTKATINVNHQRMPASESLKALVDAAAAQLKSQGITLTKRETLRIGPLPAERLVESVGGFGLVQYVTTSNDNAWTFTYSSPAADFQQLLPDFEKSAQTIRFVP